MNDDPALPSPIRPPIHHASVKVMRSYDYCHFEVVLGTDSPISIEAIDNLRKEAARLADKAVAQYKVAKEAAQRCDELHRQIGYLEEIPDGERSPEQKAKIKEYQDRLHRSRYSYEDDYEFPYDED